MKILFIGGNGNISWWCVEEALKNNNEVYELNRAMTRATRRTVQVGVHELIADARDEKAVQCAIGDVVFDVVCDFICFNKSQAEQMIRLFEGKCSQYIVITSEAVYRRESRYLPFKEDTPQYDETIQDNYILGKIEVEHTFKKAYQDNGFPMTIVRPGYTYDTIVQMPVGQNCFTAPRRLMQGYPFLMPGDGVNLAAPLHSRDFARAFIGLIGNKKAVGEDFHIAAEQLITFNEMAKGILSALDLDTENILHIPYNEAIEITDFYSKVVSRQHMWHYIYDVSKIKAIVPGWKQEIEFSKGIGETFSWLLTEKTRQRINLEYDRKLEEIYKKYWKR